VKDDYGIQLLNTNTGQLLDEYGVFTHFGVWPKEVVDYLAIVGDTSDNVPGAFQIGPKGALELIKQFSSVEEMLEKTSQISSRLLAKRVLECKSTILLSKKLVTIDCNVPLPEDLTLCQA
jgi:DNA polymerase I